MGFSTRSVNSIFNPTFHPAEDPNKLWHHFATCYFNYDPRDELKITNTNSQNTLLFPTIRGENFGEIDLAIIDKTQNPDLNKFSRKVGLPLSVIFGSPKSRIEKLIEEVYFPNCRVQIHTTIDCILFKIYKRLKLRPYEEMNIENGFLGRNVYQETELIGFAQDTLGLDFKDTNITWTHPKTPHEILRHKTPKSVNFYGWLFEEPKLDIFETLIRIGKPETRWITYLKPSGRYLLAVHSQLEAYIYK
jgi:hypothetical protein